MSKKLWDRWWMAVAVFAALMSAAAQSSPLFEDHFEGTMSPEWQIINGSAWVQDGWLHLQDQNPAYPRHGHMVVHDGDPTWNNYSISVKMDPLPAQDPFTGSWYEWGELDFRTRDTNLGPNWPLWRGYALDLKGPGDVLGASVELSRRDWEQGSILAFVPGHVGSGPADVLVRLNGPRIRVSIDGTEIIDVTDPQPFLSGGVAFDTVWESYARYDDLVVIPEPSAACLLAVPLGLVALRRR